MASEYKVVVGSNEHNLSRSINIFVREGWTIHGSVAISLDPATNKIALAQALIKEDKIISLPADTSASVIDPQQLIEQAQRQLDVLKMVLECNGVLDDESVKRLNALAETISKLRDKCILNALAAGLRASSVAKAFGVSPQRISQIKAAHKKS